MMLSSLVLIAWQTSSLRSVATGCSLRLEGSLALRRGHREWQSLTENANRLAAELPPGLNEPQSWLVPYSALQMKEERETILTLLPGVDAGDVFLAAFRRDPHETPQAPLALEDVETLLPSLEDVSFLLEEFLRPRRNPALTVLGRRHGDRQITLALDRTPLLVSAGHRPGHAEFEAEIVETGANDGDCTPADEPWT